MKSCVLNTKLGGGMKMLFLSMAVGSARADMREFDLAALNFLQGVGEGVKEGEMGVVCDNLTWIPVGVGLEDGCACASVRSVVFLLLLVGWLP